MALRVCSDTGGMVDEDDEDADGDKVSSAMCGSKGSLGANRTLLVRATGIGIVTGGTSPDSIGGAIPP